MNIMHGHFYFDSKDLAGKALDPVSVHMEIYPKNEPDEQPVVDDAPFHFTIRCFGKVWTTFFSSPYGTPTAFIRGCDVDYLVTRMHDSEGKTKSYANQDKKYLRRILEAVKDELLSDQERQIRYVKSLITDVTPVDYREPADAPRFDQIVVVKYLGNEGLFGPGPAELFNWNHTEGNPNIDRYWLVPGKRNDQN